MKQNSIVCKQKDMNNAYKFVIYLRFCRLLRIQRMKHRPYLTAPKKACTLFVVYRLESYGQTTNPRVLTQINCDTTSHESSLYPFPMHMAQKPSDVLGC